MAVGPEDEHEAVWVVMQSWRFIYTIVQPYLPLWPSNFAVIVLNSYEHYRRIQ